MLGILDRSGWKVGAEDATVQRADLLKAGYLFNFVKFVEWPASALPDVLTVCFVGGEGVKVALLSGIESKRVGTRRLAVRQLEDSAVAAGCNVLYVDEALSPEGGRASAERERPILTVSDAKAFAHKGGMIELFTEGNRLRFNVNVANVQKAGLRISSNLLQLAATVERAGAP